MLSKDSKHNAKAFKYVTRFVCIIYVVIACGVVNSETVYTV